jgi:hypothetical protein
MSLRCYQAIEVLLAVNNLQQRLGTPKGGHEVSKRGGARGRLPSSTTRLLSKHLGKQSLSSCLC